MRSRRPRFVVSDPGPKPRFVVWGPGPKRVNWVALATSGLLGCMQIGTGTGPGAGGGAAQAAAPSSSGDGGSAKVPSGTNCLQDGNGEVLLCEQIDTCPAVAVDPGLYPNCGFRISLGAALDIECICGDVLCPVGIPQTCDQAKSLLGAQSSLVVCEQASLGRCVPLSTQDAGPASSCDPQCRTDCAGAPACLSFCGC